MPPMLAHLHEAEVQGYSVKNRGGFQEKKKSFSTNLINNKRVWGDLGTGKGNQHPESSNL